MLTAEVIAFVRTALPEPPARILEVGAGEGELAGVLRELGYEVVAIDPGSSAHGVSRIALADFEDAPRSFDAAVAMLSLHHIEPLAESCATLAGVVRPGGRLVIDEFDVEAVDERAVGWWVHQRAAAGYEPGGDGHGGDEPHAHDHAGHDHAGDPAAIVAELRSHLHAWSRIESELSPYFLLGPPVRGAYLYRWDLDPALREVEEHGIAGGLLPATGARTVGVRREG